MTVAAFFAAKKSKNMQCLRKLELELNQQEVVVTELMYGEDLPSGGYGQDVVRQS